jgi:hypothetical protein
VTKKNEFFNFCL